MPRSKLDPIVRQSRLEQDNHTCQFGKIFGIPELSGVSCVKRLEAHHVDYINAGSESEKDLITVCVRCHDVITNYVRMLRSTQRNHHPIDIEIVEVEGKTYRRNRNDYHITKNQI